ncbi:MAG: hypothetical protein HLUCCA12_07720 [Rhodobacteraceae bacterium HLUCCA12]|nr:MAG: hypothetical protein HLUCCA12_07720 [Rhodobacteraceae bacterium HLUCCA12]
MSVIVTDTGFADDDWQAGFVVPDDLGGDAAKSGAGLDLAAEIDAETVAPLLRDASMIRIRFAGFADGRGFTLARRLRRLGFAGRLRAAGPVLADQYTMARRSGFDEVEIDADLAARQPADHWRFRADWRAHDYQSRLRGA